jgi:hypothetical protein
MELRKAGTEYFDSSLCAGQKLFSREENEADEEAFAAPIQFPKIQCLSVIISGSKIRRMALRIRAILFILSKRLCLDLGTKKGRPLSRPCFKEKRHLRAKSEQG